MRNKVTGMAHHCLQTQKYRKILLISTFTSAHPFYIIVGLPYDGSNYRPKHVVVNVMTHL
jgi:hypothetical protein